MAPAHATLTLKLSIDRGFILAFYDWLNLRDEEISGGLEMATLESRRAKSLNNGLKNPSPKISTLRITTLRHEGSGNNSMVSQHDRPSTMPLCRDPFQSLSTDARHREIPKSELCVSVFS